MKSCPFCNMDESSIILRNELCYAVFDRYPVSKGHLLVIPFRHFASLFEATDEELDAARSLIFRAKGMLDKEFHPDGYNIGVNIGRSAGQSIMHLHIHVIPRYKGDVKNPKGGVRGVIPLKQSYPS